MAYTTPIYSLTAFQYGDNYSATLDKNRMTIIDNELGFITTLIGDGVITGWNIIDSGSGSSYSSGSIPQTEFTLKVIEGCGIIGGYYTRTFGDLEIVVKANNTYYLYMQRKMDYIASFSGFSTMGSVICSDVVAPANPTNLVMVSNAYNSVLLSWYRNTEVDFSHYSISRSTNGINYTVIGTETDALYTDDTVVENTHYYYKVSAVDLSGNTSGYSNVVDFTTPLDLSVPPNTTNLIAISGNGFIEVAWSDVTADIGWFKIDTYLLDAEENVLSLVSSHTQSDSILERVITGLTNDNLYRVIVYSKSINGVYSSGVSINAFPKANIGPEEVPVLSVTQIQSGINAYGGNIIASWTAVAGAVSYKLTVIENGSITSDVINVYGISYSIENYTVQGFQQAIKARTHYYIKVQSVDANGDSSVGIIKSIYLLNYKSPEVVSNITGNINSDNKLVFSWTNSVDIFDHNVVTVLKTNTVTNVVTTYSLNVDIGQDNSYLVDEIVGLTTKYTITVKTYDEYSNVDTTGTSKDYTIDVFDNVTGQSLLTTAPPTPTRQNTLCGDGEVYLEWHDECYGLSAYFSIWRADEPDPYDFSTFTLIDKIPASQTSYVDYSVTNGNGYRYFVTVEDVYGRHSPDPTDVSGDNVFVFPAALRALPVANNGLGSTFSVISGFSAVGSGKNVVLSWTASNDAFDGYEVYRSAGNKYSWVKIGNLGKKESSYTDVDVLLVNGVSYYYMVRKYRNEARLYLTESLLPPTDSVVLARLVVTDYGVIIHNTAMYLNNTSSAVENYVIDAVNDHHHDLEGDIDRRVDLRANITIDSWTTSDNQVYVTSEDFAGAIAYNVYLDGVLSNIFYAIDETNKKIIFSAPTTSTLIVLECIGLSETSGLLEEGKLKNLSAALGNSGKVDIRSLPDMDHAGRVREELIPLQLGMESEDGFNYTIYQNGHSTVTEKIGSGITFYDTYEIGSSNYISATSAGIYQSLDYGVTWSKLVATNCPVNRIYYSALFSRYFCFGGRYVYSSSDGTGWTSMDGLDGVSVVRDITEDLNNVYISTNLGVYRLAFSLNVLLWVKTKGFGARSNDAYALLKDGTNIVASTEIGLFSTANGGLSWNYSVAFEEETPVYRFLVSGGSVFAITDHNIWRKNALTYDNIGQLNCSKIRHIVIIESRLVLNTDVGTFTSKVANNILVDSSIEFDKAQIIPDAKIVDLTGINVFAGNIYCGGDNRFYKGLYFHDITKVYDKGSGIIPTFYLDGDRQRVGFCYNSDTDSILFDVKISESSHLSVANQYKYFRAKNKGWIDQKYSSTVNIYLNNILIDAITGSTNTNVSLSLASVSFPGLTETNCNLEQANIYIAQYNVDYARLHALIMGRATFETGETYADVINTVVNDFNLVYSQLYDDFYYYSSLTIGLNTFEVIGSERVLSDIVLDYIPLNYQLIANVPEALIASALLSPTKVQYIDIASGVFYWTNDFNKNDILTITMKDCVFKNSGDHDELDNYLGNNVLGNSWSFGEVANANLVNMGIFLEGLYPAVMPEYDHIGMLINDQDSYKYVPVVDNSWYDVLNSTVDYTEESVIYGVGLSLLYPSVVKYASTYSKVLVGSTTGLLMIDKTTYDMSIVNFNGLVEEYVRDIVVDDGNIYVVTEDAIYYSADLVTWSEYSVVGLDGIFGKAFLKNGNFILSSSTGLYYKGINDEDWSLSSALLNSVTSIFVPNFMYVVNDNKLYSSNDGRTWVLGGDFADIQVNAVVQYKVNAAMATGSGLRYDNASFYSGSAVASLVDILGNVVASTALNMSDIDVRSDGLEIVVGSSNGSYYKVNGSTFTTVISGLPTVQKVIYVDSSVWAFGHNLFKADGLTYPIVLGTGAIV